MRPESLGRGHSPAGTATHLSLDVSAQQGGRRSLGPGALCSPRIDPVISGAVPHARQILCPLSLRARELRPSRVMVLGQEEAPHGHSSWGQTTDPVPTRVELRTHLLEGPALPPAPRPSPRLPPSPKTHQAPLRAFGNKTQEVWRTIRESDTAPLRPESARKSGRARERGKEAKTPSMSSP